MTTTLSPESESLLKLIGVKDINDFIYSESKKFLEKEIKDTKSKIDFYERKYGMTYQDFIVRVMDKQDPILSKFGIIEKEDDDFDWDCSIRFHLSYSKTFATSFEPTYA